MPIKPLTKEGLLRVLRKRAQDSDTEVAHANADRALIRYINDQDITDAYDTVPKWYA